MFVKHITVSEKNDNLPVDSFDFETFRLKNYQGDVVFETSKIDSDNTEVTLDSQTYAGLAEIEGICKVPSDADAGLLEVKIGQEKGATWTLSILSSPDQPQLNCQFGLPPTTFAVFSRFVPVPVKSVCKSGTDLPGEIDL